MTPIAAGAAEPSQPSPTRAGKIEALTGIRGIAAGWVVVFHLSTLLPPAIGNFAGRGTPIARSGFLAVDLFFLLSGFVLAHSLFVRFAVDAPKTLRAFLVGRLFRILPLNWAMLILLAGLAWRFPAPVWSAQPLTLQSFLASAALVQSWGMGVPTGWNFPAWSLSTEWAAYSFFPALLVAGTRSDSGKLAFTASLGALFALSAIMLVFGNASLEHVLRLGLPRCLLEFAAGACLWRAHALGLFDKRNPEALLAIGVAGLAVAVVYRPAQLLAPFSFGAIVIACALGSQIANLLFANRPARFLGEISFSIYLSHALIINGSVLVALLLGVPEANAVARATFLAAVVVVILAMSAASWRLIEVPGQAAGRRLLCRLERRDGNRQRVLR